MGALEEAYAAMHSIRTEYADDTDLLEALAELQDAMQSDANTGDGTAGGEVQRQMNKTPEKLAKAAVKAKEKRSGAVGEKYQSAIFKCLSDYNTCLKANARGICKAFIVICIAKQLVPLAPREK